MGNKIKFTVFADMHYKVGMYLSSVSDMETIMNRANSSNSQFIIHCGDFSNDYKGSPEIVKPYLENEYGLPVYGVYGNHELEARGNTMQYVTPNLTNRTNDVVWGTVDGRVGDGDIGYYYFDIDGFRMICVDTNYSYNNELKIWEHNKEISCGAPKGNVYPNSLGPVQLKWLETLLYKSANEKKKCIIVSHAAFCNKWSDCPDSNTVLKIFKSVNEVCRGTVIMAINGHYHTDRISVEDEIVFFDVNTTINGYWISKGYKHYSDEHVFDYIKYDDEGNTVSCEKAPLSALWMSENTWYFNSPLSAVVTISLDGKISIEGAKTEWIYGIVPENIPSSKTPKISNFEIDLKL